MTRPRVVHISTVHSRHDPRIFHKQCKSLARSGFEVALVITAERDELIDGVQVLALPPVRGRLQRMTSGVWRAYRRALSWDADIFHFHDPELIPVGLLLRAQGKKVVYDIHEDTITDIRQKPYLAPWVRRPLADVFGFFESLVIRAFSLVIAERYYIERFPSATEVCNYPYFQPIDSAPELETRAQRLRLLYTGNVTEDRGAFYHSAIPTLREDLEVTLVGECRPELASALQLAAGASRDRLLLVGVGEHVPFEVILEHYQRGGWLAGVAIFPETPHYVRKELTKFFEYMAAGLPIICSNFSVWRDLVEGNGIGIVVDPEQPGELLAAIDTLAGNPGLRRAMGQRAKQLVQEKFSWQGETEKLVGLYRKLLGSA